MLFENVYVWSSSPRYNHINIHTQSRQFERTPFIPLEGVCVCLVWQEWVVGIWRWLLFFFSCSFIHVLISRNILRFSQIYPVYSHTHTHTQKNTVCRMSFVYSYFIWKGKKKSSSNVRHRIYLLLLSHFEHLLRWKKKSLKKIGENFNVKLFQLCSYIINKKYKIFHFSRVIYD